MRYKLLSERGDRHITVGEELERQVNIYLSKGWKLHGNTIMTENYDLFQAVVKGENI